jgi:hypothetical protein
VYYQKNGVPFEEVHDYSPWFYSPTICRGLFVH